jgi:hypothetical protein
MLVLLTPLSDDGTQCDAVLLENFYVIHVPTSLMVETELSHNFSRMLTKEDNRLITNNVRS